MDSPSKTFNTHNVDLASFLMMEGVPFLGCSRSPERSNVVVLSFDDKKQNCSDLERVFINSDFKRYRDINKWLLGRVHDALREK